MLKRLKSRIKDNTILSPICHRIYSMLPLFIVMPKIYLKVIKLLREVEKNDKTADIVQRELLVEALRNALSNVPYYKKTVNIGPYDTNVSNVLEALKEFPFLEKDEIMDHPEDFISENVDRTRLHYSTSGGSTGRGIGVWRTWEEGKVEKAFFDYMWSKYEYNRRSKILRIGCDAAVPLNQFPCQVKGQSLLVSPHHLNKKWLPQIIKRIQKFRPDFIHAYPSCVEILAGYLKQTGESIKIKGVFLASEEVMPAQIELCKEVFAVPVCFHYGAVEQVLLGYGCYDGEKVSYHFHPLYGIVENYQDENANYELVGTGLWNYAMPLIRYRTQDYGKISEEQVKCEICGKTWPTVSQLDGRKQDYLVAKDGSLYPGFSVIIDKFIWDYVTTFQIVQSRPGEIELHIVPRKNFTEEAKRKILDAQNRRLSDWFNVKLVKVDEILHTHGGKRRLVIVNYNFNRKKQS